MFRSATTDILLVQRPSATCSPADPGRVLAATSSPMQRYVAFLRAINVGGHTVKMDHLRRLFQSLGFGSVETFIASGNVIFDAPAVEPVMLEQQIEQHLQGALGFAVATFLRSPAELAEIVAYEPFAAADPPRSAEHALSIAFLKTPAGAEAALWVSSLESEIDRLETHGRELYWWCRTRVSDSAFSGARLERLLGAPATLRNVTTVRKLAARYAAQP